MIFPVAADTQGGHPKVSQLVARGEQAVAARIEQPGHPAGIFVAQAGGRMPVEADGLSADAEAAFARSEAATGLVLCMANGTRLVTKDGAVRLTRLGNISVEGTASGAYLLSYEGEADNVCEVRLPGATDKTRVYLLDRNLNRKAEVEIARTAEGLRFAVARSSLYEMASEGAKSWKEMKEERAESEKRQKTGTDFPVRPHPPLAPAKNVMVVVQAEDFSGQGGGAVTVTDKKVGAQGKAFLNWDHPGHWIEWKFAVPQDGAYHIAVKCCSEQLAPHRALILDGAFPNEESRCLDFPSTGGWSNDRDDWSVVTLSNPETKQPLQFHLRAGEHTLRLVNLQDSMNLDYVCIFSPDVRP